MGALGAMPDRSLLDHFARGGEAAEAAFATLVERHGPMVLRVCRHVLADGHLAEDAFQVTFLLLARRARTIHDPDALAGWLHRVARRVALRARAGCHRVKEREERRAAEIAVADDDRLQRDELCAIVHEEIDRLADAQRLPILLCALEGLSHEEAAQRLRWPLGTVKSRLVRGRRSLQSRLARRGLAPALALAAGIADTQASALPVPLVLAMATTKAAIRANAGAKAIGSNVSASIARLLERELCAMFMANLRLAAGAVFAVAVVGIGISLSGRVLGSSRAVVAPSATCFASRSIERAETEHAGPSPRTGIPIVGTLSNPPRFPSLRRKIESWRDLSNGSRLSASKWIKPSTGESRSSSRSRGQTARGPTSKKTQEPA